MWSMKIRSITCQHITGATSKATCTTSRENNMRGRYSQSTIADSPESMKNITIDAFAQTPFYHIPLNVNSERVTPHDLGLIINDTKGNTRKSRSRTRKRGSRASSRSTSPAIHSQRNSNPSRQQPSVGADENRHETTKPPESKDSVTG